MRLETQLVHSDGDVRIVKVSAHDGERALGSALGEGAAAEEAETRAIDRLLARLGPARSDAVIGAAPPARRSPREVVKKAAAITAGAAGTAVAAAAEPPLHPAPAPAEAIPPEPIPADAIPAAEAPPEENPPEPAGDPAGDPEDWSRELARLDIELKRIGWNREQEATYLRRAFGHPSRSRLTAYADLMAYLGVVADLAPGADPASVQPPLRRSDLLRDCDRMLEQLGWEAGHGRRFLQEHLGVASRSQLSDPQLLQFNMLLENELMAAANDPEGAAS